MNTKENNRLGELIEKIAAGESEAISEIYSTVGKAMYATAYSYVMNYADAEDVVQDALITIVKRAEKFRVNKNANAWIHTIVANLARNRIRDDSARKIKEGLYFSAVVEEWNENGILVNEMLEKLTEQERKLIGYRYWYDCSLSEIARIFHRSKTNIRYKLNKIEKKLKEIYED